jgi:hypothetical protein
MEPISVLLGFVVGQVFDIAKEIGGSLAEDFAFGDLQSF